MSPGVNPLKDVEALGKKMGYTQMNKNFHNVSLGQGQEVVAESAMNTAAEEGHWVILQNIHLVKTWLPQLEKQIEQLCEKAHENYRLFLSAEPASKRACRTSARIWLNNGCAARALFNRGNKIA